MIVTTPDVLVLVTTVGGTRFAFTGNDALSAQRSIMSGQQIDAEGKQGSSMTLVRVIIPFASIDFARSSVQAGYGGETVVDDNCVVRTPAEDSGDDEGEGGGQ